MNNQNQPDTIQETDTTTTPAQAGMTNATGDVVIPEYQEELVPEKVERQEGMVHVHKDVVQEQQSVSAPVTHEQVEVERVPVHNQFDTPPADAFQGEDIDIPVQGEQLVADKQVVETEEVRLHKKQVQEQEQVSGTVRREEVEIDQPVQTATTAPMATAQAVPIDTTSNAMSTMQTAPTQDTMTESAPVRLTSDTSATPVTPAPRTPVQGVSSTTPPHQETMQQGATYRIEAEPVDDTMGRTGATAQGAAQPVGDQAKGGAQQAASNAQQGASNAKGKLDSAIDNVTDKLFGHNK